MSKIQQFYAGQTILITGGTGFLGRVLIEKLLRSCPDIKTVYLLIREKKGVNVKKRVDALLVDSIFQVLRNEYPDFSKKIVAVTGAIAEEGLGLSATDYALLVDEVSVIFHLAANVQFNANLETAVTTNVNGVKCVIDFARACKNLKAAAYASTAFSYCSIQRTIGEKLYPPPLSYEQINHVAKDLKKRKLSKEEETSFTKEIIGEWPNTYTFTKAIAEGVIAEFANDLPFVIFRPSVVICSYGEPVPGWYSGTVGFFGMIRVTGLGMLHVTLVDPDAIGDVVPVDYVCNALISCVWETAITKRRHHNIRVYNYVSGNQNPITWGRLVSTIVMYMHMYPSNSSIYYPTLMRVRSARIYGMLHIFFHSIPALVIDSIAKLFGKQMRLYKLSAYIHSTLKALTYFNTQQWKFEDHRVRSLWRRIEPHDRLLFPFNIQNVDWDEQSMKLVRGTWKYLVKHPNENLEQARRRLFYQYIVHLMILLAFGSCVIWIVWKMFSWL